MQRVLIISNSQSYIAISLKERLKTLSHEAEIVKADTNELGKISDDITAVILLADEEVVSNQQSLIMVKDKALEFDLPLFLAGDTSELEEARKLLPGNMIQMTFARPIDINEVVKTVDTYIQNWANYLKKKILVVDDSGAMLRNVKAWLEGKYQVILANSATMAIKYLSLNKPDLVLLDYEMPVCDGKQVLEMIRSESEFADVPVIFLTSKSDKESVMNVMNLKPEGYLLKTMKPEQIVANVDEFFEKQKMKQVNK